MFMFVSDIPSAMKVNNKTRPGSFNFTSKTVILNKIAVSLSL